MSIQIPIFKIAKSLLPKVLKLVNGQTMLSPYGGEQLNNKKYKTIDICNYIIDSQLYDVK
jgi:hypothetical protein